MKEDMEYQKAINYIIGLIKEGTLYVESKIPSERDIAKNVGIGRSSTREAISILRGMGLIESRHGSGNYISKDCDKAIKQMITVMLALGSITTKDIIEFRRIMAVSVCQMLIKDNSLNEEENIKNILEEMRGADAEKLSMLDYSFHVALIKSTNNSLFMTVMEAVAGVYQDMISELNHMLDEQAKQEFINIHNIIFKSIVDKDEETCLMYINKHYDLTEEKMVNL